MEDEIYLVIYTENHPDRETEIVGAFEEEKTAEIARDLHLARTKKELPHAGVSEWCYSIIPTTLVKKGKA